MNRLPINRSLSITLDGEPLSFSGRMRLRGKDDLSLFPALFTLELWNLPEEMFLRLSRAREISVSHLDACLVSGKIRDIFRRGTEEGILTSVSVSLGLELWEAVVSLTVPAGTSVSEKIRRILSASGTGIRLLADLENDSISARPRSFFGRASECVTEVLSAVSARAMLTPSGLMLVPPEQRDGSARSTNVELQNRPCRSALRITESDLTDAVSFAGGSLRGSKLVAVLSASVAGWRPGQTVEVKQGNVSFRGIIVSRSVDADTASGPWKSQMICEVL